MVSAAPIGLLPLQGRKIYLERFAAKHTEFLHQCFQNDKFMDLYRLSEKRDQPIEALRERLETEEQHLPQQLKRIEWVVFRQRVDEKTGEITSYPIGVAALADYREQHRRAELLMGIVDKSERHQGVALEMILLILDFAFNQINLNKMIAFIYGYNSYAHENLMNLGYSQEGLLKQHIKSQKNEFLDLYIDSILREDFYANQRIGRLSRRFLGWDITQKTHEVTKLNKDKLAQMQAALRESVQS